MNTRQWARGATRIQCTYGYDNLGLPISISYNDGVTATTSYAYDRRNRQKTVSQGSTTTSKFFNDAGLLMGESYSGGTINGYALTNNYDSYLRNLAIYLTPVAPGPVFRRGVA
jgi:hypothetical protein